MAGDLERTLHALRGSAEEPADLKGQPGRVRVVTWVFFGLTGVPLAAVFTNDPALVLTGIILAIPFAIIGACLLISDLRVPSLRGRRSPEEAARCFFEALRRHHWKVAFGCVLPKTGQAPEAFWKPLIAGDAQTNRTLRRYDLEMTQISEAAVRAKVRLDLLAYSPVQAAASGGGILSLIFLVILVADLLAHVRSRRSLQIELDLVFVKVASQWWVLPTSGESF